MQGEPDIAAGYGRDVLQRLRMTIDLPAGGSEICFGQL